MFRIHRRNTLTAVPVLAAAATLLVSTLAGSSSAATDNVAAPWLDTHRPVPARVEALLRAMTLPEKVGQMDQQLVADLTDPSSTTCGSNGFQMYSAPKN